MPMSYMCAFCGEDAEGAEIDPCAVIVVARWREPEEQQREQQFFAHAACLGERLHPDVAVHARVLDPDWQGDDLLQLQPGADDDLGVVGAVGAPSAVGWSND